MHYSHTSDKAKKFAADAFERIQVDSLTPYPEVFALWYAYYAGENPEVTRAIEILLSTKHTVTDERCLELYQRFLGDTGDNDRVRQAGDQVQSTIKEVNTIVGTVRGAAEKYNASLENVTDKLTSLVSKEEIDKLLKGVMAGTQDMMRHNEKLEQELTRSTRLMKDLQRDLEQVRKEALTDSLTNLANRKAFDSEIRRVAQEMQAAGTAFSLVMMDIDYFKSFNDNYGHQVGDQVLRLVARTLTEGVKGRDIAARYGGEEFALVLPDTNLPAALKVAEHLRKAVAGKEVINRNTGEKLGRITLSGGAAQNHPGEKIEDMIERADAALYAAKHNGRNQIAAAPPPDGRAAIA